ncbi:tyrosine-type recombinase/integrase [Agromyces sp. G08B096]|uniref:Tyrosine-type recombinase/integrase n=1 Tax=Agromyces sp. G08B096 TaxID=3156399 RepID=A0AAU7W969_9MICO
MIISGEWASAIQDYLNAITAAGHRPNTVYARRQQLQHLARRVEVGPWQLDHEQLVAYLGAQQWARETRRSRIAAIEGFYDWGVKRKHIGRKRRPTKGLTKLSPADPQPRPVPDQVYLEALIRAGADEALWIDLAAEHGLRRAEIAGMHSRDIVPTLLGYDLIVHGKGGKDRLVPLTAPMARALLERGDGWLWVGDDGGHISPRWLGFRVNRLLSGAWTIHKLRHRAATRFWVTAGGDPYVVAELMGWASIAMVRTYVKLPDDRLRNVVEGASRAGSPIVRGIP